MPFLAVVYFANPADTEKIIIYLESCLCPTNKSKSNIVFSVFGSTNSQEQYLSLWKLNAPVSTSLWTVKTAARLLVGGRSETAKTVKSRAIRSKRTCTAERGKSLWAPHHDIDGFNHPVNSPTVVNTVQQKNIEPKNVHLSALWSHMDLNSNCIISFTSFTMSWCVYEALSENKEKLFSVEHELALGVCICMWIA